MQRRIRERRARSILIFDDQWPQEESAIEIQLLRPLQAVAEQ